MNTGIFRKSSIDRVSAPEQLNEYIRVANPTVWLILAAIVVLLVGVIIWGIFGSIETTVTAGVKVTADSAVCYLTVDDASCVNAGDTVTVGNERGTVISVSRSPLIIGEDSDDYILYLTGLSKGDFCCTAEVNLPGAESGVYAAEITIENISPISFVIH